MLASRWKSQELRRGHPHALEMLPTLLLLRRISVHLSVLGVPGGPCITSQSHIFQVQMWHGMADVDGQGRHEGSANCFARSQVFDRTTGSCAQNTKRKRCFDEETPLDNSKTVIRLGKRDWISHDLMRTVAGILLEEKLGYSVRSVDLSTISAKERWLHRACLGFFMVFSFQHVSTESDFY